MKSTPYLVAALLIGAPACTAKTKQAPPAPGSATATGAIAAPAPAPAAPAEAGVLNLSSMPPLGPPDAIEPPNRDIVPGMSIAQAKAKGAKTDASALGWVWKPNIELDISTDAGIVSSLEVTYTKAEWAALQAKWGKPNVGDGWWLGANWLARLSGCQQECTVSFMRSPAVLLGASPVPPLGLAALRPGATLADVAKITGIAIEDRSGVGTGYRMNLGVDPGHGDSGAIDAIVVNDNAGDHSSAWGPMLEKLWSPAIAGRNLWISKDGHWGVQREVYGDTLRYTPIVPGRELLATLRALPATLWNRPKAAVHKLPGLGDDHESFAATEWSLGASNGSLGADLGVSYDDKDLVDEIDISIYSDETTMKQIDAAFAAAWGQPVTTKDADGDAHQTVTIDGIAFVVDHRGDASLTLVATRPEPPQPKVD